MKTFRKFGIFLCSIFIFSLAISACNTIRGAGEDLEQAGRAIKQSM